MNRAFYLLLTFIIFYSVASAQPEAPRKRFTASIPSTDFSNDCRESGFFDNVPLTVDALPDEIDGIATEYYIDRIELDIAISGDADASLSLVGPDGTAVELMDTRQGSWPSFNYDNTNITPLNLYRSCAPVSDHTGDNPDCDGESVSRWRAVGDLGSFSSNNLIGDWFLTVCGSSNTVITLEFFSMVFNTDKVPEANIFDITNASSCITNDGSFKLQTGTKSCGTQRWYTKFNFENEWVLTERTFDPCNAVGAGEGGTEVGNMAPGLYFFQIAASNPDGSRNESTIRTYPFYIEADNGDPDLFLNCGGPVSVNIGSTVFLAPFDYGDNCGFETLLEYTVADPLGNTILMGEYDGSRTEFTASTLGEYTVKWTLTSTADPQLVESCTEIYTATEENEATYGISSNSDDMEEWLSDNSIRDGSTDLEFGSEGAGGVQPQIVGLRFTNIQLPPNANVEEAYIQFTVDESKETSQANYVIRAQSNSNPGTFTTNAGDISSRPMLNTEINWNVLASTWTNTGDRGPNQRTADISQLLELVTAQPGWVSGNAVVFTIVGTGTKVATAVEGNPNRAAELYIRSGGDPCDNDTEAPVLTPCRDDFSVQLEPDGTVSFNVTTPGVSDNCGIQNTFLDVTWANGATAPNGGTIIRDFEVTPGSVWRIDVVGEGTVEIVWRATDDAGNIGTCTFTVTTTSGDPCDNDTEDPVYSDCPSDFTIPEGLGGETSWSAKDPFFADNCSVADEQLVITWFNGATGPSGETTLIVEETEPGRTFTYNSLGTGTVSLDYSATDDAGNTGTCSYTVTIESEDGPCANDTEDPVLTNCPQGQTFTLNQTGAATIGFNDPIVSDNCGIRSEQIIVRYSNGATDPDGNTERIFNDIRPGQGRSIQVQGAGTVNVEFVAIDGNGNTASCDASFSVVNAGTECSFDIADECAIAGQTLSLPVRVTNFDGIGAFQFDLVSSSNDITFVGIENENITTSTPIY